MYFCLFFFLPDLILYHMGTAGYIKQNPIIYVYIYIIESIYHISFELVQKQKINKYMI